MTFDNIPILYSLPLILLLLILTFYIGHKKRAASIQLFVAKKLEPLLLNSFSKKRRLAKYTLLTLGVLLITLGLARPQWGYDYQEIKGKGIDLLFAIDVSKSMLAQDIKPNRLARAKLAILDFIQNLKTDRVGIIAFSGNAFLQCPLTLDYDAFRQTLDSLDTNTIAQGGTNISAAIDSAELAFQNNNNHKVLILITDGENLHGSILEKAKLAAQKGLIIHTIGVGTPEGELIQITNSKGERDYLRDNEGKIIKTKLDEETLKKISSITNGLYSPLGNQGEGLSYVYKIGFKDIQQEENSSHMKEVPIDRFHWFLGLGLLFLILEVLLSERKRSFIRFGKKLTILLLALGSITLTHNSSASAREADKLYKEGNIEEAKQNYLEAIAEEKDPYKAYYNIGTIDYQEGSFPEAINNLKQATLSDDLELQKDAFYNLANAEYKDGESMESADPEKAMASWESAIKNYQNVLDINSEDKEALYNQEYVKKRLEELKQQQEQKQEQQDQQQEDNQDSKDNNSENQEKNNEENKKNEENQENQEKQDSDSNDQSDNSDSSESDQNSSTDQKEENNQDESSDSNQENNEGQGDDSDEMNDDNNSNPNSQEQNDSESEQNEEQNSQNRNQEDTTEQNQEEKDTSKEHDQSGESDQSEQGKTTQSPTPRVNGQMTQQEAADLLDSLKGSEKKLPSGNGGDKTGISNQQDYKDW